MKRPWSNSLVARFFLSYLVIILVLFSAVYLYSGAVIGDFTISSAPPDRIEEPVASIRRAILAGLVLASGAGLLLAFLLSRHLSARVGRMAGFSREVAQGPFPREPLPVGEADELSELENNLNEMSRGLQEKIQGIMAEKEKVDSILRCMTEGVVVVDTRGRIIVLNENAQRMFDLDPSQSLQGASLLSVSRHPEMKRLVEEVLACDCSSGCFSKELFLGEGKCFRVNATSLRGGDARSLGYIVVFHDITELKRLEVVRADFVANVSHELRTPLTAIRGYAETLLRATPEDPKEAENFLKIIQRHSERLGRLIDDLLTLSDLESGKVPLAKENVDMARVVGQVLEIFQDQARKKSVTLSHRIRPDSLPIAGDSDRLQQLLINLVDNALKYTPSGGRVEVSASLAPALDHERPMVEIAVADTGHGIPEKDLPRLTERFYRVDKARSRELGGTGLGLAIVKHIVQAHRGHLKIESQIQKGTTVRVSLPAENGARG
jgi:two-component system phosphate regulon sensor histidine kinase PhoR